MKTTAIAISAFAALAAAQDYSGVPECGRFCAEDMVNNKGGELDCDNGDIGCLCQNQDFIYGLRDCSSATCDDEQNARSIVEWGVQLCEDAGVAISDAPTDASGSPTASATATDDEDGSGGGMVSTYTSDGSTIVTTMTPVETVTTGTVTSFTDDETSMMSPTFSPSPSSTGGSGDDDNNDDDNNDDNNGDDNNDDNNDDSNDDGNNDDNNDENNDDEDAALRIAPAGLLAAGLAALMI